MQKERLGKGQRIMTILWAPQSNFWRPSFYKAAAFLRGAKKAAFEAPGVVPRTLLPVVEAGDLSLAFAVVPSADSAAGQTTIRNSRLNPSRGHRSFG